ncbi:hypothetical protein LCGC14_2256730 [marine sediment metagenome]|uniref:UDP-N-acetylglucosamine 2-epimerase domain-containing protein n=1 Tax=marine sediment metagenome TaxID=412755 RepID=A0A0F9DND8_9ZZZZ
MAKSNVICTVTGIRPDFIRMSEVFRKLDENFTHIMIHTGQHYDTMLSDIFFEELSLRKPDYNLCIGAEGRLHYDQQALLGPAIIKCLKENNIDPAIILFLGDANTSLASIPLKKEGYHIGHIEAGMRSGDEWMPEEINRVACDHVSSLLFAYHDDYVLNLLWENIPNSKIFNVGNTIVEVLNKVVDYSRKGAKNYIFVDIHRQENVTDPRRMKVILDFCNALGTMLGLPINMLQMPRTQTIINDHSICELGSIKFIPLMNYTRYIEAVQDAVVLISDSGTAQEEPALLGTPVIVPRTSTERGQAVINGSTILIDLAHQSLEKAVTFVHSYNASEIDNSWLGNGCASERIINILGGWCDRQRI